MRQLTFKFATTFCVATALICTAALRPAAAEDFFSSDSLKQVFNPPAQQQTEPAPPQQAPTQPDLNNEVPPSPPQSTALAPAEIPAFLSRMGFESEDLGGDVYKIVYKKDEWNLPYAFVISPNKTQFWVTLSLNTLEEGVTIPHDKLLKMLQFNHKFGPYHFAYSDDSRRIYVCRALKNDALTPADVKAVIEVLAELAINHEDLWNHNKWQTAQQPQAPAQVQQQIPQQQPAQPQTVQPQPAPRHVGTWRSTAGDNSTFQLTLNADGTFVLYHVHDGTTDKSVGRYTLVNNALTLIMGENDKLESFVTWNQDGTWRFQVKNAQPGAQGLLFAKA